MKHLLIVLALMLFGATALADTIDTYHFDSVDQEQQYRHLTESLRCPKCQNNSIADSNSMIAADMRLKVYELLRQGQTPEQIKAWMIDRYGNFVSYQPPVQISTLILWAGPLLFVIIGGVAIVLRGRKPTRAGEDQDEGRNEVSEESADQNAVSGAVNDRNELHQDTDRRVADIGLPPDQKLSRWALLPGGVLLVVVSVGFYLQTGGLLQVLAWQQVKNELPALRAQVMDPQAPPLDMAQLARLALGIRSELQQQPHNLNDWMLLGRLGVVLNNATTASQSFERALRLAPDNQEVRMSYVEVLTRSVDPQDNRQAAVMLDEMLQHDPDNLRLLDLLAFNAFVQQNYTVAIHAWDKMLALIPEKDERAQAIRRSIEQARSASGQ